MPETKELSTQLDQETLAKKKIHEVFLRLALTPDGAVISSEDPHLSVEGTVITHLQPKKDKKVLIRFVIPSPVQGYAVRLQVASVIPANAGSFTDTIATLPIDTTVEGSLVFTPATNTSPSKPPLDVTIRTRQKGGGM